MKKLLLALALLLIPSLVWAQCNGVFGANQVCGSVAGGPPAATPSISFPVTQPTLSGDCITSGSVITCTKTNGTILANPGSATTDTTNASNISSGILALTRGGTGASTQQGALNAIAPPPTRPGDVIYWNGTNWVNFAGNNSGIATLTENGSGVPSWLFPGTVITSSFGASGSSQNTTGTISATSNSLALASALDFANGQGIRVNHAGAAFTLNSPTAASATPTGASGATTYQYKLASLDGAGGVGAATSLFQTTTGNATLSATNYNALSWTAATGTAPAGYAVYKNISGTFTLIGVASGTSFNDYGYTGWPFTDWIPTTAPASSLADYLVTTISSGAGTTSLTLAAAATTNATSQGVFHDDTTAVQAALNASTNVFAPPGNYYTTSQLNLQASSQFSGVPFQTTFQQVNIGQTTFNLVNEDNISGLAVLLLPNGNGFSVNTHVIDRINNILCQSGTVGLGGIANCVNIFNGSYQWIDTVFLDGWFGAVGQGTRGAPPAISVSGTSGGGNSNVIQLDHVLMTNDGTQISNAATITFNDVFNSSIAHTYLNAVSTTVSANWAGVEIEGNSQGINIVDLQALNFVAGVRTDVVSASSPLSVMITNSLFDFCGQFCVLLQNGSWVNITNSSFSGEAINGNVGIHTSASFVNGPNVFSDNSFNGFSGSGSNPITFGGTMTATNVFGNQFANNGANANITGNGASIFNGSTTGGHVAYDGSGTAPTLTAGCNGAGSSISGTDISGTVSGQTAVATSCTVNFGTTRPGNPRCVVSGHTTPVTSYALSTSQLVINFASTASAVFDWICYGA